MQSPRKIENVKKIYVRARKVLYNGIDNFAWTSGSGQREVRGSLKKFSGRAGRVKGRVRLFGARGSVEVGKVASRTATQSLWLGDRKVGSQVIDEDRSQLPGRGTVGEVRRGGRRASDGTKQRVHRFRVRFR